MTSFRIERLKFTAGDIGAWGRNNPLHSNWPVVYTIDNDDAIYVGETGNTVTRMNQHLKAEGKEDLQAVQVIIDETFNKSACLDLESFLIRLFDGDGKYQVRNRNTGITDSEYYERETYQNRFKEVFDELRTQGYFERTIPQIINSDLFKLSPFKALTQDQAAAVEDILEGLFTDLARGDGSTIVVEGNPGTGKTILAIYLAKLLRDIEEAVPDDEPAGDDMFADFFTPGHRELLQGFRIGLVVPQQSLRNSIKKVFKRTPGLNADMVLTPFEVGASAADFDLLIVDEAHRLNQLSAQAAGVQTKLFREIQAKLFGVVPEALQKTQLDWIRAKSRHQVFLLDLHQRVRPSDAPTEALRALQQHAVERQRVYPLTTQMRVKAGADYVGYVRQVLSMTQLDPLQFEGYDLRFFDDFDEMYEQIQEREREEGLARLVAGYAWKWRSSKDPSLADIHLGSHELQWNRTDRDWINSPTSPGEVGSIHTVQGYDLNYAGVIIGGDLRLDQASGRLRFDRANYFDTRGKANNHILGKKYTDDDLLELILNIYGVLLTRGMRGTYVYVVDEPLRKYLRPFFSNAG
ncbi:MAG: DUF2075 domain-containing protein [Propionibacteriaceae bacterium]|nr:DUF2075 domain-containing protein [Propionibacteriaceae bacterium]